MPPHGQTETWLGHGQTESVVGGPGAVSPDRALCLLTFSHFVIVNKTDLSLPSSLSLSFLSCSRPRTPCTCCFGAGAGTCSPPRTLHVFLWRWCWQKPPPCTPCICAFSTGAGRCPRPRTPCICFFGAGAGRCSESLRHVGCYYAKQIESW
jgi:hypothetical protein